MGLKRPAYEDGIAWHHVGEKSIRLRRQGAFPRLEIEQIFGDDDPHEQWIMRVVVHGESELREVLVEQGLNVARERRRGGGDGSLGRCWCVGRSVLGCLWCE